MTDPSGRVLSNPAHACEEYVLGPEIASFVRLPLQAQQVHHGSATAEWIKPRRSLQQGTAYSKALRVTR